MNLEQPTDKYITNLILKGFNLKDEDIGFIYFGKKYIELEDALTNLAIDTTLKIQKSFDGSFYIALLEAFKEQNCQSYNEGKSYLKAKGFDSPLSHSFEGITYE